MKSTSWLSSPRIFIIEDNIADCRSMSNCLSQAGFSVEFALDGRHGLSRVLENLPQCLILNAILPGMSGYAICRRLRTDEASNKMPIIITGSKNSLLDQNYSFKMGASCYLAKPFAEDILLQAVEKVLPDSPRAAAIQAPLTLSPHSIVSKTALPPEILALIPYHRDDSIMLNDNPFARSSFPSDRASSRLHSSINGHRTIREIADLLQLDLPATLELFKTLWQKRQVGFYDSHKGNLKDIAFFDK